MRNILVQAQKDHIASLCTASPIQALAELIWNALDADAFDVKVDIVQNALGGIDAIRVTDDGLGINAQQAERHFGNLGGSWKRDASKTPLSGRVLHGCKGKGRFKAFALGNRVEWRTTREVDGGLRSFLIAGNAAEPGSFVVDDLSAPGPASGTEVTVTDVRPNLGSLLDVSWVVQQLASCFALYLKAYPNVRIYFQGLLVNPVIVQHAAHAYHIRLPDNGARAELQVIEWKTRQGRGKIVFCNHDGFALHEVDAAVRPGSGFNYTAYLVSPRFSALHGENLLVLDEMHPEIKGFLDAARDILRKHFHERRESLTTEQFHLWQQEGSYPFADEPADEAAAALRQRFDTCAMLLRAHADNLEVLSPVERTLLFRLLRDALDADAGRALAMLADTFKLPPKKRRELLKS